MAILFKRPNVMRLFISLFLTLAILTAFSKVQNNDFINLDDNLYVTDNYYVKKGLTFGNLLWAFTKVHAGHWHPITWLSHMLDVELFGLKPSRHHTTNLLFHIINTLLLFFLFQRMTGAVWRSSFVGSLFALHPLHVESVAWVAERKDVLCAFFFLLTIFAYIYYVERIKISRYLLMLLCFGLALMSKPMAVTLPFVLLLLDYWPLGRLNFKTPNKKRIIFYLILEKIPLFLLTTILSIFTIFNHLQSGAVASFDKLPLKIRIENVLISYIKYILKMFWPDPLAVLYPHPIHLPFWEVTGALLLLIFITATVIFVRRKHPYLIVGWLWYLGTFVPVIGLVQVGTQAMADRFTYLPLIGLFVMIAHGLSNILTGWRFHRIVLITFGISILLVLTILSAIQVDRWQNSVKLFTHTLNVTVNNSLIHNNLGVTLMRQGKYSEALIHYKKALEIKPIYADAQHNLGSLLFLQGNEEEALGNFTQALQFIPEKAETHNAIGVILAKQGKLKEALFHFTEAVRNNKDYEEAHYNLGTCLLRLGGIQEAITHLNQALRVNPKDAKAHSNLALALKALGRIDEAIAHYTEALHINPNHADAHFCLASLLSQQGKEEEAILHFNEALKINPNDIEAHYELGNILFHQRKNEEAIAHLVEAIRINPNHGKAHLALGEIYLSMGKKELAFKRYKILKRVDKNLAEILYQKISRNKN